MLIFQRIYYKLAELNNVFMNWKINNELYKQCKSKGLI